MENSEFKPVKLRLKIDLVSYPARAEGLVNRIIIIIIIINRFFPLVFCVRVLIFPLVFCVEVLIFSLVFSVGVLTAAPMKTAKNLMVIVKTRSEQWRKWNIDCSYRFQRRGKYTCLNLSAYVGADSCVCVCVCVCNKLIMMLNIDR